MCSNQTTLREFDHLASIGRPETEDSPRSLGLKTPTVQEMGLRRLLSWLWERPCSVSRILVILVAGLPLVVVGLIAVLAFISVLPAMIFGLAVGLWVAWGGMRWNSNRLLQLPNLSRVGMFRFDGKNIRCAFSENLPLEIGGGRLRRIQVASLGVFASVLALLDPAVSRTLMIDFAGTPRWFHALITGTLWFLPLAIGVLLYTDRQVQRFMVRQLMRRVNSMAAAASADLGRTGEIDGLLSGIDALSKSLRIEPPSEHQAAIANFVQKECAAVVLDAKYAELFIKAITELARQDLANLAGALSAYQQCYGALQMARASVLESRNPLLETRLNDLELKIADLGKLLTQRRWDAFQRSCTGKMEELRALQERARLRREPPAVLAPGTDPYSLLGINREMPTASIKKLRTRLAQIYHPDASEGLANAPKMAEVNAAFDAVIADRRGK